MAARITRPSSPTTGTSRNTSRNSKSSKQQWLSIQEFFKSQQFQLIAGILLLFTALMLLIAYISFFFTGANDMSIIEQTASRSVMREAVTNALGLPGAIIASGMIDGMFGIMALLPILLLGVYALRILFPFTIKAWKLLFCTLFSIIWGAIALGYVQQLTSVDSFFRWGGAFGQQIAIYAISYIQALGLGLILLATLIIFLIVIDKHFVDHCQQLAQWVARLFKKKQTPDIEETPAEPELPENIIDIVVEQPQEEILEEPLQVDITPIEIEVQPEPSEPQPNPIEETVEISVEEVKEVELSENDPEYLLKKLGPYDPRKDLEHYKFPSLSLLKVYDNETAPVINQEEQQANANQIVTTLRNFGIEIESIKATVGPTVTLYEIVPKAGIKISKIQGLENDIMLSLAAMGIRIIAPIPGKGTIGIEVPNEKPQTVSMHSVIASKRFQEEKKMRLPIAYGRTITNEVFMFDLAKTPHLLVAGATGTGKSVAINAIITSLLYAMTLEITNILDTKIIPSPLKNEALSDHFFLLLAKHYKTEHSVSFYADKMALTPKYLTTAIKRITGKSILTWINNAIIIEIKIQLKTTDKTILQISEELNFSTPSAMIQFFKLHVGTTPLKYRHNAAW